MVSWLTHLRIAAKIKEKIKDIDLDYLMMGIIAPDSEDCNNNADALKLSKSVTHYKSSRLGKVEDINIHEFYDKFLLPEKILIRSDKTRSFLWGYYFHLLTDKAWLNNYIIPFQEKFKLEHNIESKLEDILQSEFYKLDADYLKDNGSGILNQLKQAEVNINFFSEIEAAYIHDCRMRVLQHYSTIANNTDIECRYITESSLDSFISKTADRCIRTLL